MGGPPCTPIAPFGRVALRGRLTAGLRSAPPSGSRLGLGPSLAQSRRLLKAEAQPSCHRGSVPAPNPPQRSRQLLAQLPRPRSGFVNPRAVIRNGSLGDLCLRNGGTKPNHTFDSGKIESWIKVTLDVIGNKVFSLVFRGSIRYFR